MATAKRTKTLENFNILRLLVGFLGEKRQSDWWGTDYLSEIGLQFLVINFPRTSLSAGCNSVIEAARRIHDERIGKGGVFHLFRFPIDVEEDLHRMLLFSDQKEFLPLIKSRETALAKLKSFVSDSVGSPEGPVQVGVRKNMVNCTAVKELAIHYYEAFQNQKMCFPYFKAN